MMRAVRRRVTVGALLLAAVVATAPRAAAQQQPTEPTVESVQAAQAELQAATDVEDIERQSLVSLYEQTLADIRLADEWRAKAREFEEARSAAPELLEDLRARLAEPAPVAAIEVPPDASLNQLELLLAEARAADADAREEAASLEAERLRRANRRGELPALRTAAQEALDAADQEVETLLAAGDDSRLGRARLAAALARRAALREEVLAHENEIASYEARGDLLTARRDMAARVLAAADQRLAAWQEAVNERRRAEAAEQARVARLAEMRAHPAVAAIAARNRELAEARQELAPLIERAAADLDRVTTERKRVADQLVSARQRIETVGLTDAVGLFLRQQRERLPDIRRYERNTAARTAEIGEQQLALIELEERRADATDVEARVAEALADLDTEPPPEQRAALEQELRAALTTERDLIDDLIDDTDTYFVALVDLDARETDLVAVVREFITYIDEHVLWVASHPRFTWEDVRHAGEALVEFLHPRAVSELFASVWRTGRERVLMSVFGLIAFAFLLGLQQRLRGRVDRTGELVFKPATESFAHTVKALVLTLLLSLTWPLVVLVAAGLLDRPGASEAARAVGAGLRTTAYVFALGEIVRRLCRRGGVGEAHFRWHPEILQRLRRHVYGLLTVVLPVTFVVRSVDAHGSDELVSGLGRLAFMVGVAAIALFMHRVLHRDGHIMQVAARTSPKGYLHRLRLLWYALGVFAPIAFGLVAAFGYYYAALRLVVPLHATLWLVLVLTLIEALTLRWLFVTRLRLARKDAQERAAAAREAAERADEDTEAMPAVEPSMSLLAISQQARRILRSFVAVAYAVGLWLVWVDFVPALGFLRRIHLDDAGAYSLADVFVVLAILALTVIATRNIPGLLEILVLKRLPIEAGTRYAATALARYTLALVGLALIVGLLGIDWADVQWLLAAVTVGLGFGLQEIFANFVSGLIILLERPVRVGDAVTVGDVTGTVTRIRMRATNIVDLDRKELIVPNKEFITNRVVNWTLSDPIVRVIIHVGVAYGSDTDLAKKLLLEVAKNEPKVLDEPPSRALFMAFGDSALELQLRVYVQGLELVNTVADPLCGAIDKAFKAHGIVIAFPQRDIHVKSVETVIPHRAETAEAAG